MAREFCRNVAKVLVEIAKTERLIEWDGYTCVSCSGPILKELELYYWLDRL